MNEPFKTHSQSEVDNGTLAVVGRQEPGNSHFFHDFLSFAVVTLITANYKANDAPSHAGSTVALILASFLDSDHLKN